MNLPATNMNLNGPQRYTEAQIRKAANDIIEHSNRLVENQECSDRATAILASLLCMMGFSEDRAIPAAANGRSIEGALLYVKTAKFVTCNICAREWEPFMVTRLMPCGHELCKHCCKDYFTTKIRSEIGLRMVCLLCDEELDVPRTYKMLKYILLPDDYKLLDRKLLDISLAQDNFRHCPNCNAGFIVDPTLKRPICPECRSIICAGFWLLWEDQHMSTSCDDFKRWKAENEPEFQHTQLELILKEDGIRCPKCQHRSSRAWGGCLHCVCTQCKYEFCSCCKQEFSKGKECSAKFDSCADKGLHAHHPRNCFYHVRDYSVEELIQLVKEAGYKVDEAAANEGAQCTTILTDDSMRDIQCEENVYKANMCMRHFTEYLGYMISNNGIDTAPLMTEHQLRCELKRNCKPVPEKYPSEDAETYTERLRQIVMKNLPIGQGAAATQ